jgi:A/G-specific adenine glycosylase
MAINLRNKTGAVKNKNGGDGYLCLRALLVRWFAKVGRDFPWRQTRDAYVILVSEVMLQQAAPETVSEHFGRWMNRYPDFKSLAAAPESDVLITWQGLGPGSRARNLHRAAKQVMKLHGGVLPHDLEFIRNLPGLDRFTAGMVVTLAFDEATPVVDANIARVLARLQNSHIQIDSVAGQKALWDLATTMQPDPKQPGGGAFNEALMELGTLICLPGRPKCSICPVCGLCKAKDPEHLPAKSFAVKPLSIKKNGTWIGGMERLVAEQKPDLAGKVSKNAALR